MSTKKDEKSVELPVKRTTGDTLKDRMTDNAYDRILPARYLRQDENGEIVESQEELFERVAKNVALAEAVYAADREDEAVLVEPSDVKPGHSNRDELVEEVFGEGVTLGDEVKTELTESNVSKFAYDTVVPKLDGAVRDAVEETRDEFQEAMERLSFIPNSPTLMNAGDELQQLSACFVDSPADDMQDIHETAKEAAEVFQCLTDDARVRVQGKGVVSVADVEPGDSIVQRDGDGHEKRNVEEAHAYDDAPVHRLVTEAGIDITGTPNHELLVDGEWTRIDETEPGDGLALRLGWLGEKTEAELEAVETGARWSENRTVSNDEVRELHSEGLNDYEIAEVLDTSPSTVQRRRSIELGLDPNGSGGRTGGNVTFDSDEFERLHEDGHTDSEIADELGVSTRAVVRYRESHSLDSNGTAVKTVTQPTTLTPELTELVGMWVGDGSKHQDGIRFHLAREETLEHADRLCRELFDAGLDWRWEDGCYDAVIHSHEVKRWWLANFGGAKPDATEARVPELVWSADRETVAAFLRGLFSTDGSLGKDLYPRLWSSSEELIDGVQNLLLGIGIPAARWEYDTDDRDYYNVGPTGKLGLERFIENIGFVGSRAETMRAEFESVDSEGPSVGRVEGATWHVPVESVEEAGTDTVYDVTVAEEPEYVANSVVSHNSGGGMGYAFWKLRPYGDPVGSTGGIASGPITFMRTFDQMCETIAQGGTRRGAQMGVMRVSHPDVIQFIHAKNKDVSLAHSLRLNDPDDYTHTSFLEALEEARELIDDEGRVPKHLRNAAEGHLSNFNISVGVSHDFMEALENSEDFTFTNPRTGEPHAATEETKELYERFDLGEYVEVGEVLSVPAEEIWTRMIEGAYENGEPGVIYLDRVNDEHSFDVEDYSEHEILATNPCGEQPLEEYEACNLGHINLSTLVARDAPDWRDWYAENGDSYSSLEDAVDAFLEEAVDWEEFDRRIDVGTRFLENVVTMSDFPIDEIEEKVAEMRKIGLGIMGLAQMYVQTGVRYGSEEANEVARQLMRYINHESKRTSHELAEERGVFDEWHKSKFADPTEYEEWFEKQTGESADDWEEGYPVRNHNTTTIAPTGCVDEDSLISTDEGLRSIKNLDNTGAEFEQWGKIDEGVATDGGTKTATAVYDNGFADVRRIQTEGGFSVAATPNHRFRTLTGDGEYTWKEADDFEPDDRIVLQRDTFEGGPRASLDTSERENYYRNTDEVLELPDEMTPELAEFLGYFMGDGYVHDKSGVKFVVESDAEELDEYLRRLGESVFGVTPTVEERGTRHMLIFGGRHLPRFFADNGWKKEDGNHGEGAASAFVPDEVLRSDEDCAKAFLRGLFEADGTASRKIELSTVSPKLAEQVQTLLLSLGCVFVRDMLETEDMEGHYGERPRHVLRGANKREDKRFLDEIGFVTKSTDIELTPQSHKNDTYPPAVVEHLHDLDGYEGVSEDTKHRVRQSPINGSVTRKLVRDVEMETGETVRVDGRRLTEFYAAPVESVTEEKAYTKDISVPSNNTYVANGFVTHNTTSMIGNTTGGCEPIYNVAYYKNVSDDVQGDEMLVEFDDYFLRVLEANEIEIDAVKEEAKEQMAANEFDGVDGLETVPDAIGELFVTTGDLSAKEHAAVQCACQEGVDSAISKCLEEGTLVQTDSGVRPIESFADEKPEPGEFVDVDEAITIDGVPVESQYYAGEKDATRVRVDNGTELVGATESHRVLTPEGWKVLGELEEGDYVVGRHVESHGEGGEEIGFRGANVAFDGGAATSVGPNGGSVHEKAVEIPSEMSPRLARFLGMYAADGAAVDSRYSVEISTASEPVREEVRELFEELFGREPYIEEDTRRGDERDTVFNVGLNSKPVWEFVTGLCGSGSYEKEVPREVLQGSPEEKLAFVNGVTLDGYVSSQSLVVYGGMSEDLADGVAELLRSFGVPKVYVGRKWVSESDAYTYQVHVTNDAHELVTPVEPHKNVERFEQRYRVHVPQERVDKTEFHSRSTEYYAARNFEYRDRNYMFDETAENLGIEDAPPLYEVTEVEDAGTREMYDIELAGPHEYVVGGVVSHNTVNAPNNSTVEDAKEVFEFIYENGGKGVTYYRDGTRSKQVLTTRADNKEAADDIDPVEEVREMLAEGEITVDELTDSVTGVDASDADTAEVEAKQSQSSAGVSASDSQSNGASETTPVETNGATEAPKRGDEFAPRPRPDTITGATQKVETGYGGLYVTINEDDEGMFEVFARIGKSGGYTASFTEAIARLASLCLRSGIPPEQVVEQLEGIRSPKVTFDRGEQVHSVPDAMAKAMTRYMRGETRPQQARLPLTEEADEDSDEEPEREAESDGGVTTANAASTATQEPGAESGGSGSDVQEIIDEGRNPECPECGSMLVYTEGCVKCNDCGFSEC